MKKRILITGLFLLFLTIPSCTNDQDDNYSLPLDTQIRNFIWKGLNGYYLWQSNIPDLADNRFDSQNAFNVFAANTPKYTDFFNSLLYKNVDRFSVIVNDYSYLENLFQGVTTSNGVKYVISFKDGSKTDYFGYVRYIVPNSDASTKDIKRGDIFYAIDDTPITVDNFGTLISKSTYTLNLADYDNGKITPNGKSVTLTKAPLIENPVYLSKTFEVKNHKIGYLVYNGFIADFENDLNIAFANLKNDGVTDFVLDLRYNPGGSVDTANRLATMITGQFSNQVFCKQKWNNKIQPGLESERPESLIMRFKNTLGTGTTINTLNLSKVYILTSRSTASASELVINCLKPYISVVQVGENTVGKNVGSITLYDSPTFSASNRNPNHKYAMQPIVVKLVNNNGFGEYETGLKPDYTYLEEVGNLGIIGDENEPLLSIAIDLITKNGRFKNQTKTNSNFALDDNDMIPFGKDMHLNHVQKLPTIK